MTFPIKKVFVFAILFFFVGFLDVQAATITVTDSTEADTDNGLCSIVEAIANANTDSQSGSVDCASGSGTDTISLDTDVVLDAAFNNGGDMSTATPNITGSLTVDGEGNTITLTGDFRAFYSAAAIDLAIVDIVISGDDTANAAAGGVMYIDGVNSLSLNDAIIDSHLAGNGGVIYAEVDSSSTVSIEDSSFIGNEGGDGGVLYVNDTVNLANISIDNSYFSLSLAGSGGVFYFNDVFNVDITSSVFYANESFLKGGVIDLNGNFASELNITNNFFVANMGGGGVGDGGVLFMTGGDYSINAAHNTFLGNGQSATIKVSGTNSAPSFFENNIFTEAGDCEGDFTNFTFTNNLAEDSDCGSTTEVTNMDTSLADNGGLWDSIALQAGSNAIDAGVAGTLGCPTTDARSVTRPVGAACDIGAFELGVDAITVTQSGGSTAVTEDGATDTFTLYLENFPSASVTINLTDDNQTNVSPTSVTFLQADWPETKTVTVSAVDDSENEDDTHTGSISFSVTSGDAGYNNYSLSNISVSVADNDSSGSSGSSGPVNPPPPPPPTPIPGCTNPIALNYNSGANTDNGSCTYPPVTVLGCTDSSATNYNPLANQNNGSCTFPPTVILGCTDSSATNYDSSANTDNGSCMYPVLELEEEVIPVVEESIPVVSDGTKPELPVAVKHVFNGLVLGLPEVLQEIPKNLVDAISVAGLALPTLLVLTTQPATVASIPLRLWNLIPTLLGFRRKKRPWGTVYDSVTKQPLDPVYVKLTDMRGREVATTITDIDGRFGFLVAPGTYRLSANKDNYVFPSQRLAGKDHDELYDNLYFQEEVTISNQDDLLIRNIPMDSQSFNWNEFEKAKNKNLMKFYSRRDLFLAKTASVLFILGIVSSLVLMFMTPVPINFIILCFYGVVLILRAFGVRPKKPGYVIEKETGFPLSFGIIKIFSAEIGREVAHVVIGKTGKYYTLVPNGEYYMQIMKKTGEDTYEKVFQGEDFAVRGGYIGKVFKV